MSQLTRSQAPHCFGQDDEYNETSSYCRTCSWAMQCRTKISNSINKISIREARDMKTSTNSWASRGSSQLTKTNARTTTTGGNTLIRPVKFNHQKPLVGQYATYVMYDAAESMATRAVDLIRSCREEYEKELFATKEE